MLKENYLYSIINSVNNIFLSIYLFTCSFGVKVFCRSLHTTN